MPAPFKNPPLMIVGDSLAQGCRSLSVTRQFCAQCYGATAAALGLDAKLSTPDGVRAVLLQLEDMIGDPVFGAIPAVLGGIGRNYADWRAGFAAPNAKANSKSGAAYFDNLAVAGYRLEDTLGRAVVPWEPNSPGIGTPDLADAYLAKFPGLDLFNKDQRAALGGLHIAVNSRFVLNPSNDPQYRTWTQLDWAKARQPQNLILHVGHNNGLYAIGSRGEMKDWNTNWVGPNPPALGFYREILQRLATDLPNTRILVLGLPKVGAVANLMPDPDLGRLPEDPAYFRRYETIFPSVNTVEGAVVRAADQSIAGVNAQISAMVAGLDGGSGRWSYFDVYSFFEKIDFKNSQDPLKQVKADGYKLDNTYVRGVLTRQPGAPKQAPKFKLEFATGGLQSIDGMHPTAVGYALLGVELAGILRGAPVSQAKRKETLDDSVDDERLIEMFPAGLPTLLDLIERFNRGSAAKTTPDEAALADSLATIHQSIA